MHHSLKNYPHLYGRCRKSKYRSAVKPGCCAAQSQPDPCWPSARSVLAPKTSKKVMFFSNSNAIKPRQILLAAELKSFNRSNPFGCLPRECSLTKSDGPVLRAQQRARQKEKLKKQCSTHTQRAHSKITLTYAAKTAVYDIVRPKSPVIALPKRSLTRAGFHHVPKLC